MVDTTHVSIEYRTVLEIVKSLQYHNFIIVKFNLYFIRYKFMAMNGFKPMNISDINRCPDYEKYKKWYKLVYRS